MNRNNKGLGQLGRNGYIGTIDLDKRPVIHNNDGSISTEKSFSFSPDGKTEVLIPSIVGGVDLVGKYGQEQGSRMAVDHFYKTGEHLGTFRNDAPGFNYDKLEQYANGVHEQQDKRYSGLGQIK